MPLGLPRWGEGGPGATRPSLEPPGGASAHPPHPPPHRWGGGGAGTALRHFRGLSWGCAAVGLGGRRLRPGERPCRPTPAPTWEGDVASA